jgi:peroxiredoxin Q/BCP
MTSRIRLAAALAVLAAAAATGDDEYQKIVYVRVGDPAPDFQVKDDQGEPWRLSDHCKKKYVVLYFYLGDFFKNDVTQACAYRDELRKIEAEGAEVVGISGDAVENHQLFKEAYKLPYTLLSDDKGEVGGKLYGVAMSGGGDQTIKDAKGKDVLLVRGATAARWTWVIDKQGRVVYKNTTPKPEDDAKRVLKFLHELNAKP